jgi:hypothetical protein
MKRNAGRRHQNSPSEKRNASGGKLVPFQTTGLEEKFTRHLEGNEESAFIIPSTKTLFLGRDVKERKMTASNAQPHRIPSVFIPSIRTSSSLVSVPPQPKLLHVVLAPHARVF